MEFFAFTPSVHEEIRSLFLRFDMMLDKANSIANLGISFQFRTWMLLSLLRLLPKKWSELLKECGRRLPRDEPEYQLVKSVLIREKAIEDNVKVLHRSGA